MLSGLEIANDGWWDDAVLQPLWVNTVSQSVPLDELIGRALAHSLALKAASDQVMIRQTVVREAGAAFDWKSFAESKWRDVDEPVGSTLTTGGPPRLLSDHLTNRGGIRQRNQLGGEFEAWQQLGLENSNSLYFEPKNQGQTKLALSYRQPLLRGAGRSYNRALIVLAEYDVRAARDQFVAQLQDHLFDVTRAYWLLYQERAVLVQKRRSVERVAELLETLEQRHELDVANSELVRTRATFERRRAALLRAEAAVHTAESRLRMLINDPDLPIGPPFELLPGDLPYAIGAEVDFQTALAAALHNRPDISRAIHEMRLGAGRLEMSQREMLPVLEMILETYVMGLDGGRDVWGAWGNQFTQGPPSYSAGVVLEVPLGNRAAQARLQRRQLELRQLQHQLQLAMEQVKVDVELAVREIETAYLEMQAEYRVMLAAEQHLDRLQTRWRHLPGEDGTAGLVLNDLFFAQDALAEAEGAYVRSQVAYNIALVGLQRATGTLLHDGGIMLVDQRSSKLPGLLAVQVEQVPSPFMAPLHQLAAVIDPPSADTFDGNAGTLAAETDYDFLSAMNSGVVEVLQIQTPAESNDGHDGIADGVTPHRAIQVDRRTWHLRPLPPLPQEKHSKDD